MKFKIFRFRRVISTNSSAIRIIKSSNFDYGMIISENQKSGRGQYGKKWISYNGNLFVSFFYKLDHLTVSLKKITAINCLLVKKLLSLFYDGKILIKKPNDLLINKKKISGILQETLHKSEQTFIIVGIGINLIKSPKIKAYPTTNLLDLTNVKISSNNTALKLKKIYEKYIPILPKVNIKNINKI